MKQALLSLNFPYVDFAIEVENSETHLSTNGMDHVRFLISLNAGQEKKPLSQVASGGELSRIMLALKSVLAEQDETETLIFDEIDAGIIQVNTLGADVFAPFYETLAGID